MSLGGSDPPPQDDAVGSEPPPRGATCAWAHERINERDTQAAHRKSDASVASMSSASSSSPLPRVDVLHGHVLIHERHRMRMSITASANSRLVDNKEVFSIRFCSPPKRPHEGSVEAPLTSQAVAVVDPDQIPTCKQRNGFLHMVGLPSLQRCLIARMEQR
jgi:hypothetical protein